MSDTLDKFTQSYQHRMLDRHKLYVAERSFTFSDTSSKDCLVIRNPSGSGIETLIFSVEADLKVAVLTTQLNQVLLITKVSATFSAVGTAVTTRNLFVGGSDTTTTEIYHTPTVTAGGNTLQQTIGTNDATNVPSPIRLKSGEDLLIGLAVNAADNSVLVNIIFGEE